MRGMQNKTHSKAHVAEMFDKISATYDTLNHTLSFGLDFYWRNVVAQFTGPTTKKILDCATGTGDQLLALAKKSGQETLFFGIDPAFSMLEIAKQKLSSSPFADRTHFSIGKADALPFPSQYFDLITMSFGIRNVENLALTLQELKRVLSPSGHLVILEFSLPKISFIRFFHLLYLRYLVPIIGQIIAKDPFAYRYLADTIEEFPYGEKFCHLVRESGFATCTVRPLSFGITSVYVARKEAELGHLQKDRPVP